MISAAYCQTPHIKLPSIVKGPYVTLLNTIFERKRWALMLIFIWLNKLVPRMFPIPNTDLFLFLDHRFSTDGEFCKFWEEIDISSKFDRNFAKYHGLLRAPRAQDLVRKEWNPAANYIAGKAAKRLKAIVQDHVNGNTVFALVMGNGVVDPSGFYSVFHNGCFLFLFPYWKNAKIRNISSSILMHSVCKFYYCPILEDI